jgi:hypothetical protein
MGADTRRHQGEATPVLDPKLKAELKRLAILFLVSAITLVLVVAYAVFRQLDDGFLPDIAWLMWATAIFGGCVATYFYGLYVTIRARAWGWVVLCAIPVVGSVPACVAYTWIRRGELERRILGGELD